MNQDRDHVLGLVMKTTLSLVRHHDHLAPALHVRTGSGPLPMTWLNHAAKKVQGRRAPSICPLLNHDGEDEDDKEYESEEIEAQDVCEEEGEEVVCMTQRLLCSIPQLDNTQRKKIFESKCIVNGKVCKLMIDSCSCENLIS
jgi:hypothetical protein